MRETVSRHWPLMALAGVLLLGISAPFVTGRGAPATIDAENPPANEPVEVWMPSPEVLAVVAVVVILVGAVGWYMGESE